MKCVNAVDDENIFSAYSVEQGWRVAVFLLFVDMSLIPMQTEWKSVSIAPPDRIIKQYECEPLRRPFKKKFFKSGLLSLLCGAGNFGKIWSACQQHDIQRTK
jgi:hypothetical protein